MRNGIGRKPGILAGARTRELFHSTGLRALFALVLAAAIIGTASTADAAVPKRVKVSKKDKETRKAAAPMPKGPLHIIVSIGKQRVALYANGVPVATSAISSGTKSHPTPTGVFSIIQKNRHHRSNIYSGAPMPYMQRITWSGVALHQGVLPGISGVARLYPPPHDFASYLWTATKMNARVIVTQGEPRRSRSHIRACSYTRSPSRRNPSRRPLRPLPRSHRKRPSRTYVCVPRRPPTPARQATRPRRRKPSAQQGGDGGTRRSDRRRRPPSARRLPERNKTRESSKLSDNGAVDKRNTIANAAKERSKDAPVATGAIIAAPAPAAPAPATRTAAAAPPLRPPPSSRWS